MSVDGNVQLGLACDDIVGIGVEQQRDDQHRVDVVDDVEYVRSGKVVLFVEGPPPDLGTRKKQLLKEPAARI